MPVTGACTPMKRSMDGPQPSPARSKRPRVAEENRKRAVRACDGCRKVKEKCEGGVPCQRCARYNRDCVFNTLPDQGEKATRSVDRFSERTASFSHDDDAEAERVHYMERILAHYVPGISFDIQSLRKVAKDLQKKHHGRSVSDPPTQVEVDDLDDLAIDDEDFTIRALPDNTMQYSGEFSYLNFSMKIRREIDKWMQNLAPEDPAEGAPLPFEERWRATQLQSGSALVSAAITCLPPSEVTDFLIQISYKYAQTNNFYVEEDWLREKLSTCYNNPANLTSSDAPAVCAILMVLAIGTQFAHMDSPTPVNKLMPEPSSLDEQRFSEDELGLTFYSFASKLLPDIIATASVRSVQACLLLGTYLLPMDTSGLSYTYFGLALKMAIQNGMHRKYSGGGLDPRMLEVRNRVFWTAYTIEKRISILHGRPASITDADVDADLPVDLPSLRSQTQLSNYTNMVALIRLTLKLGEIASQISLLRKCPKSQQTECLEKLLTQRRELIEWWGTLPEETYCRDLSPAGGLFRSNVHLKLDYCLTRIFIGRPFQFSNVKNNNHPSSNCASQRGAIHRSKIRSILVTDCVEAALEIVDLCRLLRDETGLARASFTEFSSCRAALLVILAQSLTKRTERLRNALSQGMGLIKSMSMGVGFARAAVNNIEALERAIRRLDEWSEKNDHIRHDMVDSGYERFKNWEMLWKTGPISPVTSVTVATPATTTNIASHFPETPAMDPPQANSQMVAATDGPSEVATTGSHSAAGAQIHASMTTIKPQFGSNGAPVPPPHLRFTQPPTTGTISQSPYFALEGFISNFPQELDEFTAIPYFDTEVSHGVGREIDGITSGGYTDKHDNNNDSPWMEFMNN